MGESISQSVVRASSLGLTQEEARRRLLEYGPNIVTEKKPHPIAALLGKFWAPVPWMLEVTIVLELALGKFLEAGVMRSCWFSTPH